MRAAGTEIVAVALYLATMLALIFGGAGLGALIAASGALPLYSGAISALVARRAGLGLRLQRVGGHAAARDGDRADGRLAARDRALQHGDVRVRAGRCWAPTDARGRSGCYEGPVRAHNLLYALGGALAVPVVPTASRYVATRDDRRLRDLVVRGTRYTLALFVPVCVTLIVLAEPILDAWLGDRYGYGDVALAILVSYWLLYGGLVVTPGFLVGAGRAREVARIMVVRGREPTWRWRSC